MSLDDLTDEVTDSYTGIGDDLTVSLDRETRNELALLETALEPEETDELVRRAIHMLFSRPSTPGNSTSSCGRPTT